MTANFIITNIRIIDPVKKTDTVGDVWIEDGKFKQIGAQVSISSNAESGLEIIDASGKVLAPGFIDLHTHLREPGFEYKETIATGAKSAAMGGFTTICCMANTDPVNDNASVTQYILDKAKSAVVKVLPIGAISKNLEGKELAEIAELKQAGCIALSDDGKTIMNSQVMRLGMEYAKGFDLPVITHCIDSNLAKNASMHEGLVSCHLGLKGMPHSAEDIIIARDILLAETTGAHLHIAHLSTAGGVELVRSAKQKGLRVTAELTPHHFSLTDQACENYDTHAKMCPPLREQKDIEAVIAALADGTIDCIATDHAPHAVIDKEIEFENAAMGILGFETAFALAYRLVLDGKISLLDLIASLTSKALNIINPHADFFKVGSAADFVILDLEQKWTYSVEDSASKSRNSPFHGWSFCGRVLKTYVNGECVYE